MEVVGVGESDFGTVLAAFGERLVGGAVVVVVDGAECCSVTPEVEGAGETLLLSFGSSTIGVRGRIIFLFSISTAEFFLFYFRYHYVGTVLPVVVVGGGGVAE